MPKRIERPVLSGIKHGRSGYRSGCGCEVCRKENNDYINRRRQLKGREQSGTGGGNVVNMARRRKATTESSDSVGPMEKAIIAECENLERTSARPTLYQSALKLAKVIDSPEFSGAAVQTTKQLMAIMKELHGDDEKSATGKRKSGGRLATVGALVKVKRQGA
jgi:hypothetical protein